MRARVLVAGICLVLAAGCRAPLPTADPRANADTVATLQFFKTLEGRSEHRLLSGQFANFGRGSGLRLMTQIHEKTGQWPAILGVDYADFQAGGLTIEAPNRAVMDYWRQGGWVSISAHLYNPARTNAPAGGLRDGGVDLGQLLDPVSDVHARWMAELDQLAEGLQQLKDAGVVVLWRPFHEMNGGWFWWGGKDPATFIRLWRQMFDYFTRVKKLNNLLWVYSPNHGLRTADYYPGDDCVDLVGLDAYTDNIDPEHIRGYPEVAAIGKPFGFTEFGPHGPSNPPGNYDYLRFLDGVRTNFPKAVFFMSWNGRWSLGSNTNVSEFLNNPYVANRDELPKLPGRR
ncbi:MAG: glycosyl hydrolase [Verrucomicrobiota bacterium]